MGREGEVLPEEREGAEGRREDRGRRGGEEGPRLLRAILRVGGRRIDRKARGGRQLGNHGKEVPRRLGVLLFVGTTCEDYRPYGTHGGLLIRRRRSARRGLAGRHGLRYSCIRRSTRQVRDCRGRDDDARIRTEETRDQTAHEGRQGSASGQASASLGEARLA